MRVLLALLLSVCAFGVDVCEVVRNQSESYVFENKQSFYNKNSELSDKQRLELAFKKCAIKDDKSEVQDKEACLYIFNNFVVNKEWDNLTSFPDLALALVFTQVALMNEKDKEYKEAAFFTAIAAGEFGLELMKFGLKNTNNNEAIKNLEFSKTLLEMNQHELNLIETKSCPLFYNGKLTSDKIEMPCVCRTSIADTIENDRLQEAFLKSKLLCNKYKDGLSCGSVEKCYEHGMGVRVDLKQGKKYYGLSCDYGYQPGCDGYKRLIHF